MINNIDSKMYFNVLMRAFVVLNILVLITSLIVWYITGQYSLELIIFSNVMMLLSILGRDIAYKFEKQK